MKFKNLSLAEVYYYENLAKNNEDEAGLERWLEQQEIGIPTPSEIIAEQMEIAFQAGKKIAKEEKCEFCLPDIPCTKHYIEYTDKNAQIGREPLKEGEIF